MRKDGKLLGFCVEWADAKERLANIDFTAQIRRHQPLAVSSSSAPTAPC